MILGRVCWWCLLWLLCLFHLSSVVTDVCDGFKLAPDRESVEPQFFFSLQKAFGCVGREKRRDGLCRVACESASEHQKKDIAAYATANFVFFDGRK